MNIPNLDKAARIKGVNLVGTGDFTHPFWLNHLKEHLSPCGAGLFKYGKTLFLLTAEVSNVFYKNGKMRKIHNILLAPDFDIVEKINKKLERFGDLYADGRPTLKLKADELVKILMDVDERVMVIPAHIWTPWFSLFGSNSGFDSIEECFEDVADFIIALETGLSSDPAMNWQVSSLDRFVLVSNSDAHSPQKLGREANVFSNMLDYEKLRKVLMEKDRSKFLYTLEFFPQEGKYHWDGHRKCQVSFPPEESVKRGNICPKCGEKLTIGVLHRVKMLADRPEKVVPPSTIPFKRMVPLKEIIAEAVNTKPESKLVKQIYDRIVNEYQGEIKALLEVSLKEFYGFVPEKVIEGISRVREGKVKITCGYDGVYGQVKIFDKEQDRENDQLSLF